MLNYKILLESFISSIFASAFFGQRIIICCRLLISTPRNVYVSCKYSERKLDSYYKIMTELLDYESKVVGGTTVLWSVNLMGRLIMLAMSKCEG